MSLGLVVFSNIIYLFIHSFIHYYLLRNLTAFCIILVLGCIINGIIFRLPLGREKPYTINCSNETAAKTPADICFYFPCNKKMFITMELCFMHPC